MSISSSNGEDCGREEGEESESGEEVREARWEEAEVEVCDREGAAGTRRGLRREGRLWVVQCDHTCT